MKVLLKPKFLQLLGLFSLFSLFSLFVTHLHAAEVTYIGFGGGYAPQSSQVVLEKNLELFQSLIASRVGAKAETHFFYGAGNNPDLMDVIEKVPSWNQDDEDFSRLLPNVHYAGTNLRHNHIQGLDGSESRSNVINSLAQINTKFLRFYFTGHGSPSDNHLFGTSYTSNVMNLWNNSGINIQEFAKSLDRLPERTESQVLMVQCFSGGFAQINYVGGDPTGELSPANRCGFFSQLPDRYAAGCTPDVRIRQEYSPFFFAALAQKDEAGNFVDADYNHDGKVTPAEAHAYVIIHENAVDVPITTSSALLRSADLDEPGEDLQKESWAFFRIRMTPAEQAIVAELGTQLGVDLRQEDYPVLSALHHLEAAKKVLSFTKSTLESTESSFKQIWGSFQKHLLDRYPFLGTITETSSRDPYEQQRLEEAKFYFHHNADYKMMEEANGLRIQAEKMEDRAEKKVVKWERLIYLFNSKMREEELRLKGSNSLNKKYDQLLKCESDPFF